MHGQSPASPEGGRYLSRVGGGVVALGQTGERHPWISFLCGSSVRIDREELPQHPHSVASTVGAPSCCGCWTRDWRAPSLPQVGTITVLNCVMAGAPASASRTPL